MLPDLLIQLFSENNRIHFDDFLDQPVLQWNPRLRSCAGRFIPGNRKFPESFPPKIEVASYLLEKPNAVHHIRNTLGHEMIHYWLWERRRPYGHTAEFWHKMEEMGVSRYNLVPKSETIHYEYECTHCKKKFRSARPLGDLACLDCCSKYSNGKYNSTFKLILVNPPIVHYD